MKISLQSTTLEYFCLSQGIIKLQFNDVRRSLLENLSFVKTQTSVVGPFEVFFMTYLPKWQG